MPQNSYLSDKCCTLDSFPFASNEVLLLWVSGQAKLSCLYEKLSSFNFLCSLPLGLNKVSRDSSPLGAIVGLGCQVPRTNFSLQEKDLHFHKIFLIVAEVGLLPWGSHLSVYLLWFPPLYPFLRKGPICLVSDLVLYRNNRLIPILMEI